MQVSSFKELTVWERSMTLAKLVYAVSKDLPKNEQFSLASQLRRSAVSIPSNIAEGSKRGTRKDYAHFLKTANGSAAELETQLLLTQDLYQPEDMGNILSTLEEVQKMLNVMIKKLTTT